MVYTGSTAVPLEAFLARTAHMDSMETPTEVWAACMGDWVEDLVAYMDLVASQALEDTAASSVDSVGPSEVSV